MRCIQALERLSGGRMLLVTADRGYHREAALLHRDEPDLTVHGSFSLPVNYHAIAGYVARRGGRALLPAHHHEALVVAAFLFGEEAEPIDLLDAWSRAVDAFGPDDFFAVKKAAEKQFGELTAAQMLAVLRLAGGDSKLLLDCFGHVLERAKSAPAELQQDFARLCDEIWDLHYHLGEERDLAFHLGLLLQEMGYCPEALRYLEHSVELYGPAPVTSYITARCYHGLRQMEPALVHVERALAAEPGFLPARSLRLKIEAALRRAR
jgi:tetratricopeptide (TPR) repeat protein